MRTSRKPKGRRGFPGRDGLLAAVALVAGLAVSASALAGALFEPVTADELALALRSAPTAGDPARQRFAKLNRAELAAHMVPLDMDRAPDRVRRAQALDGRIEMALKPGLAVALKRSAVDRVPGGGYLWSADVLGRDGAYGSFLIERGQMLGAVHLHGTVFKIEPVTGVLHRITEIDPREVPGDIVVPAPPVIGGPGPRSMAPPDSGPEVRAAKKRRPTKIRMLVAYTDKARRASSNIVREIRFAVAWSNRAFKNSGVKIALKLLKTKSAKGYDEDSTSYSQNLYDLQGGVAFAGLRATRDRRKADLVALIREGGEYCGVAFLDEPPTAATAGDGFSVTSRGPCIPATFTHEVGHNLGLRHDRYVEPQAPASKYNYGFVNTSALIRTIMAYRDRCSDIRLSCVRIQSFSTPRKTHEGAKIGQAKGRPGAADGARQLNRNRAAVAAYR